MKHLGTKYIETSRLILRKFTMDDAEAMFNNWASSEDVTKYMMWKRHENIDVSREVLREWTEGYAKNDFYEWAILFKEYSSDKPIGSIGIDHYSDKVSMCHVGYCIGKKWWHKGITSEALSSVIKYLFDEVGCLRIESRHDARNINSGKVMEKCGMKYEGTLRQSDYNNTGICDAVYRAILLSDR